MKITKFVGTPEEFKAVSHLFEDGDHDNQVTEEAPAVSRREAIRAVFKRIAIPEGQKQVYKALANGEISYDELVKKTQRSRAEQAGVMGALGHRVNGTPEIGLAGLPQNITAIINYRKVDDTTFLSLTDDAKAVLLEEGII